MNPFRKKSSTLLIAAGLALTAVTAFPQSTVDSQRASPLPGSSNADNNPPGTNSTGKRAGTGTTREITAEQFMAIDTNYDGRVSLEEFVASPILSGKVEATTRVDGAGTPRSDETTSKVDADAQGRSTPELFHKLDKNENGFLNSTEIAAFYQTDAKI